MSVWAIVPVKDPNLAKSRLAAHLPPPARRSFTIRALEHVIDTVRQTPGVDCCLVISRSVEALAVARQSGVQTLLEPDPPAGADFLNAEAPEEPAHRPDARLNAAVEQAARAAATGGASAVLVLPSDLPLVTSASLAGMISSLGEQQGLVIAPDRHLRGTNALLVRPPLALRFAFGPGSFDEHRRRAEQQGLPVHIYQAGDLALDIDTIDDVTALADGTYSNEHGRPGVPGEDTATARESAWAVRVLATPLNPGLGPRKRYCHGR